MREGKSRVRAAFAADRFGPPRRSSPKASEVCLGVRDDFRNWFTVARSQVKQFEPYLILRGDDSQ